MKVLKSVDVAAPAPSLLVSVLPIDEIDAPVSELKELMAPGGPLAATLNSATDDAVDDAEFERKMNALYKSIDGSAGIETGSDAPIHPSHSKPASRAPSASTKEVRKILTDTPDAAAPDPGPWSPHTSPPATPHRAGQDRMPAPHQEHSVPSRVSVTESAASNAAKAIDQSGGVRSPVGRALPAIGQGSEVQSAASTEKSSCVGGDNSCVGGETCCSEGGCSCVKGISCCVRGKRSCVRGKRCRVRGKRCGVGDGVTASRKY